jgi:hypothetical protein
MFLYKKKKNIMYDFDNDPFFNKNKRGFDIFKMGKYLIIIMVVAVIAIMAFKGVMIVEMAQKKSGHFYVITVDDRNNSVTHESDSIITKTERCVKFRSEFGFIQEECGDRVSIIQIK